MLSFIKQKWIKFNSQRLIKKYSKHIVLTVHHLKKQPLYFFHHDIVLIRETNKLALVAFQRSEDEIICQYSWYGHRVYSRKEILFFGVTLKNFLSESNAGRFINNKTYIEWKDLWLGDELKDIKDIYDGILNPLNKKRFHLKGKIKNFILILD